MGGGKIIGNFYFKEDFMKKLVLGIVCLFSLLSANEIAWEQNILDGIQYHVECSNGTQSDIFYYYNSKRYFVGGIGNYATLDRAKKYACKKTNHIVRVKKGALVLKSLKKMKDALRGKAFWSLEHYNSKDIMSKSVDVNFLRIIHIKGKRVHPESSMHYIDDIVKISDDGGNIYYAKKSDVIF